VLLVHALDVTNPLISVGRAGVRVNRDLELQPL
jgi:hypothetical protein